MTNKIDKPHYQPPSATKNPRFSGIRTFMRLPHVTDLNGLEIAITGVPFDTGASYRAGARFGPEGVRRCSGVLRPANLFHGINPFDHCSIADIGDIPVVPGYIEDSYAAIEEGLTEILEAGVTPVVIGGDHSITLAELRAVSKKYGPVALVHFDAHGDTWDSYWGKKYAHGTPFKRGYEEQIIDTAHSIQIGMRGTVYGPGDIDEARDMGFEVLTSDDVRQFTAVQLAEKIKARVGDRPAFLTFDIDFFDPAYAPGTGTPEVGGFTSYEGLDILRRLTDINFVGYDLVEIYPGYDSAEITALLGATVVFEFLSLHAVQKRGENR